MTANSDFRQGRTEEELLADFFENAAVGLHWVGPDGTILRANRAELELLGYSKEEYIGHHVSEFHADKPTIEDILTKLRGGETLHSYEARLRCKDGSIKNVLISSNVLWEGDQFIHTRCFTRDITEHHRAREELRQSENLKSAILHASLDAIITMNHEGVVTDFNAAGEKIFGYARATAIGRTVAELIIPPNLRDAHHKGLKRYLATGEGPVLGRRIEQTAKHSDGHEFPVELSISRIPGIEPPSFTATLRDISDMKRLIDDERASRAEAERMSAVKDQFLATLSHELRTPLSAILGWTQVLRRQTKDNADLQKGLETIERNARMQTQLIEDLLDMSRITSGQVRLDTQIVQPISFIEASIETVMPSAAAKDIRIEKVLDPMAGPISGDPARLQQVIWNLLSNAVKFTPKKGKVQVLLERIDSQVEITIADTGIGIQPDFIPHLFERFRQADASTTREYTGLGLGLSIVKQLVELHGGTVRAESAGQGHGAIFMVRLPVTVLRRGVTSERFYAAKPAVSDLVFSDLSGVKVLVVDDEPDARELIDRLLADCGAEVFTASSAAEGLEILQKKKPDVVVSDIGMPLVDGYEFLKQVRALGPENGGNVNAIALTAFARSEDRTRALRAGFLNHVAKPVEAAELIASVASAAGRAG